MESGASNNEEEEEGDDGLFGSIGFMFDTAREKATKKYSIQFEKMDELLSVDISLNVIDDNPGHVQSGQYLWPAAHALSTYLLKNWSALSSTIRNGDIGLNIVELGSGIGMCGLFLSKYLTLYSTNNNSRVVLTDYDPGCLQMISDNIALNGLGSLCCTATVEWGGDVSSVLKLDKSMCSLVVGSDLLYCVSIVRPLFLTVHALLNNKDCEKMPTESGMFILASSFDVGDDVRREVENCCRELNIRKKEIQPLDLSGKYHSQDLCCIQHFHISGN